MHDSLKAPHEGAPYIRRLMAPRQGASCVLAALLLVLAAPGKGAPDASGAAAQRATTARPAPDLKTLLQRSAAYARGFELAFTRIIGRETWQQTLRRNAVRTTRLLESEVFFLGIDEEGAWVTVRDVLRVDGQPVRGSRERIDRALDGGRRDARRLLTRLADEGARYNLGDLRRNFSDPALALSFVDPDRQPRFRFELGTPEVLDGTILRRLTFRETRRPTLIRSARDSRDVPASGAIFVTDDGAIRRTEMHVDARPDTIATIRVTYRADARLGMLVPDTMDEEYRSQNGSDETVITGRATYTGYRRFETSGRIIER
jgi:hypothetical protein